MICHILKEIGMKQHKNTRITLIVNGSKRENFFGV